MFSDSESLVFFFVIHPEDRAPFQNRFRTSELQKIVTRIVTDVATAVIMGAAVKAGAVFGSIIPGPGTVAGAALGLAVGYAAKEAFKLILDEYVEDIIGQYLRYVG